MKATLEKIIRSLVGLSFVVPLFLAPFLWKQFIFPFIVPKVVLLRSIVLLIVGCYILLLMINFQKYKIRSTPITLAVFAFLLSFTLSSFIGVDWYRSFWDNHERMLGLFTVSHYVVLYLVATQVLRTKQDWKIVWQWALALGSLVVLFGFYQRIDAKFLLNQGNTRVSSSLGNAIYLAGYSLFLFYLGFSLFLQEAKKSWKKYLYGAASLLGFSGIFLSSTRGTLLGVCVAAAIVLGMYAFRADVKRKHKRIFLGLIVGGVALFAVLFYFRQTDTINNIPALGRLLNSYSEIRQKSPRLMAWGIAIDSWQERPVFGWGPNNYYYSFNKYYRPEYLNFGWGETWFDNAHNVVLNTLAVQGIVGLVSYISLFAVAIIFLVKKYRQNKIDVHTTFLAVGFLIAHFIHNIFVFENPTSYLYFFLFLAYINALVSQGEPHEEKKTVERTVPLWKYAAVLCIIFYVIYTTNIQVARANTRTFTAIGSVYSGQNVMASYEAAINTPSPHIDDVRSDIARAVESALPNYVKVNRVQTLQPLFDASYQDLKKNEVLHPLDVRIYIQQAQLAELGAQYFNRPALLQEAEVALDQALMASPKRQQIQYMLGMLSLQLGKLSKGEELLTDAVQNNPRIAESWWRLALFYAYTGNGAQANKTLEQAAVQGVKIDASRIDYVKNIIHQVPPAVSSTAAKSK